MTRPHPIVGITAELADRRRGRADQPHVRKDLDHEGEELVAPEEGFHRNFHAGILRFEAARHGLHMFCNQTRTLLAARDVGHGAQHIGRNVDDLADEAHLEPRSGNLLGARHGPKAVFQVIVLHRRQGLNRPVAAMVVGEQQSFGRDDLTRAAAAEDDDGILQRRVVHTVNLLGREFAAAGLHVLGVHLLEVGKHPHPLVRCGRKGDARGSEQ